jgi:hypothetical protein
MTALPQLRLRSGAPPRRRQPTPARAQCACSRPKSASRGAVCDRNCSNALPNWITAGSAPGSSGVLLEPCDRSRCGRWSRPGCRSALNFSRDWRMHRSVKKGLQLRRPRVLAVSRSKLVMPSWVEPAAKRNCSAFAAPVAGRGADREISVPRPQAGLVGAR